MNVIAFTFSTSSELRGDPHTFHRGFDVKWQLENFSKFKVNYMAALPQFLHQFPF